MAGRPTNREVTDKLYKRLNLNNPVYEYFFNEWRFYISSYEGGQEHVANNIHQYCREDDKSYQDRVKRAHYENYCEPLIDFFTKFIFSEPIERSDSSPNYYEFIKDVDRKKTSIDSFMSSICDDMQIFGCAYTIVDAPRVSDSSLLNKLDESLVRPYWVSVLPFEIIDWIYDDFGNFIYVRRKQELDNYNGERSRIVKFTEYTPVSITVNVFDVSDKGGPVQKDSFILENKIGVVPIVKTIYKASKKYPGMGLSFIRDFAYNNRELMNLTSSLQESFYKQSFSILTKQQGSNGMDKDVVIGHNSVLEYPPQTERPQYISPSSDPAQLLQKQISIIKQEMFSRAFQDSLNELFNGEKRSGFSQAQSFSKTVPFISTRAETLEETENKLMELTYKYIGQTWSGKIKYKDRYELTNLTDAMTQLSILFKDLNIGSETFIKEELKRMVREYDSKLPIDTRKRIESEIDNMDFDSWKEEILTKGKSPAAQQKPKQTGTMLEAQQEARVSSTNQLNGE